MGQHSRSPAQEDRTATAPNVDTARFTTSVWQMWLFGGAVLAALGFYLSFVASYAVNVVYWDEFSWVPLVRSSQRGTLSFSALWALHNADRELFPNLVAIALALLTHWDDFYFFALSALLLTTSIGIILWVCRREMRRSPLWFVGIPVLGFTLAQYENTLWAYQIAWYIVLFALVSSIAILLEIPRLSVPWMVLAGVLGVISSYSSFQGLLVWPAGFVILLARGRRAIDRIIWAVTGVVVIAGYFLGFSPSQSAIHPISVYFHRVPTTLKAVVLTIGNVVPNLHIAIGVGPLKITQGPSYTTTEVIGAVVACWGIGMVAAWVARGRPAGIHVFAVALIVTGLGFDITLVPSRLYGDPTAGLASRYVTMNILLYVGIYLATVAWSGTRKTRSFWSVALLFIAAVMVVVQAYYSTSFGITEGQLEYAYRTTSADIMANAATAPVPLLEPYLDPSFAGVYSDIAYLKSQRMSIFDGNEAARLRNMGILPCCVRSQLVKPSLISDWTRSASQAIVAWHILSAVAVDFMSPSQQRAFEAGRSTIAESRAVVVDAAGLSPIPATELLPGYPPPSTYFLEADSDYYRAWAAELKWHRWTPHPPPGSIREFVDNHPLASLAWRVLVGEHANKPALRSFSLSRPTRLLMWAAKSSETAKGPAALIPLRKEFEEMARLHD
jgi:hypothetical protein